MQKAVRDALIAFMAATAEARRQKRQGRLSGPVLPMQGPWIRKAIAGGSRASTANSLTPSTTCSLKTSALARSRTDGRIAADRISDQGRSDQSGGDLAGMGVIGSERRRCEQASFHRSCCWRSPAVTACLGSWPALIILIGVMLITWSTEVDPPTTAERPRLHTGRCGGGSWGDAAAATLASLRTSAHCSVVELPVTEATEGSPTRRRGAEGNARAPR
jgi:hypothetical protein